MVILSVSVLISAAYAMRTVGRLFTGPVDAARQTVADLNRAEMAAVGVLSAGILLIGFYPALLLSMVGATVGRLARLFGG